MLNITDIRIKVVDNEDTKIRAIASITIDGCFVVHDLKVIASDKGDFVVMPSKKTKEGKFQDLAHPINTETRNMIQDKVLAKYNEVKNQ